VVRCRPCSEPRPIFTTYDKLTPDQLACPGTAGRYADPLKDSVAYAYPFSSKNLDAVTSLAPKDMALGQVVPFEMEIEVSGSPANGIVQFTTGFNTHTTSGDDFGFDPSYMVYCAFVDTADPGNIDPGNNAKVDSFTSTLINPGGGSTEQIQGTFQVSGLEKGDNVIVEIWVVLKPTIPPKSTGNVQTELIGGASQTVPLLQIGSFFTEKADVSVIKEDSPDPVTQGQQLTYSLVVTNNDLATVANGIVVTDTLDPNTTFVSASGASYTISGNTITFNVGALSPGQTVTLTINTMVSSTAPTNNDTSTDPEQGSATSPTISYDLLNSVSVTAITSDNNPNNNTYYQPTNVLSAFVPNPAIDIEKSTNGEDADEPTGPVLNVGDKVTWEYVVTNTGNVPLTDIVITDDQGVIPLLVSGDDGDNILQPGEVWIYRTTGTAVVGQYSNMGTVTGNYNGMQYTDQDPSHYYGQGPTGQICPTQTTCDQYMSGIAVTLTQASYNFNSKTGTIKSVSPGVMFYYSTIVSDGTLTTISVDQSNSGGWPAIAIQDTKQVILYDSSCTKISGTKVEVLGSKVTLTTKTKLPAGNLLLGH